MAILSKPSASARPAPKSEMISLEGGTQVPGTIEITSVTRNPPAVTLEGEGEGFFVTTENGVSTIHLQPTSSQIYPVVYILTLDPLEEFPFAEPVGLISLSGQDDGFLLSSATLQMLNGDQNLHQPYNLALQFFDEATQTAFWVRDPTIVFEPPS